jgi:uncharacterized protein (TIGR02145 family)
MKFFRSSWFCLSILIGTFIMISNSCKKEDLPSVTTVDVTSLGQTSASCGGTITSEGGSTVLSRGVCWGTNATPKITDSKTTDGAGAGSFTSAISGLSAGTKYFVRAYATNSKGTAYGMAMSFTTMPATVPVLTTADVTNITETTAACGGNITTDGAASITARGVCWSTSQNPTISDNKTSDGSGTGDFTSTLIGLTGNTVYYVRTYGTNNVGTAYGNQVSFKTVLIIPPIVFNSNLTYGSISDIDGNIYKTIQIGTQTWMAENLKTSKYNNGTTIPLITDSNAWQILNTPAYCWYNNDAIAYKTPYGALYNWYSVDAVSNGGKNVCPTGWHVPSNAEWNSLITYLGGESVAGGKLKETGTTHWLSPNTGATNESGFTALPNGSRSLPGTFSSSIGSTSALWSSTESIPSRGWLRILGNSIISEINGENDKQTGFPLRCIKDN